MTVWQWRYLRGITTLKALHYALEALQRTLPFQVTGYGAITQPLRVLDPLRTVATAPHRARQRDQHSRSLRIPRQTKLQLLATIQLVQKRRLSRNTDSLAMSPRQI